MDRLRAGVALFNAGHYLAAHEPWEKRWLDDEAGDRRDCLQGLIQATAAVYKAQTGNWSGAVGLAESAVAYLDGCGHDGLRSWLARLESDPELAERERPPQLRVDAECVSVDDLQFPAAGYAAEALAETRDDEDVEHGINYAIADIKSGDETSQFVTLTLAYLRAEGPAVRDRLVEHAERRRSREQDVDGLFE